MAKSRHSFLFQSPNPQNPSANGDLPGHGHISSNGDSRQRGNQRGAHRNTGRRPILGNSTLREMNVDILCPKEFVGDAMSQVTQRGGMIQSLESKSGGDIIHAQAPMAKMFGFSTNLRSVTQGRASFSMEFSHFQVKPGGLGNAY